MGSQRKEKEGSVKINLETYRGKEEVRRVGWQRWNKVRQGKTRARQEKQEKSRWSANVETLCAILAQGVRLQVQEKQSGKRNQSPFELG